jgi:hypothetical protein
MDPRDLKNLLVPEIKERILTVASGYPISELGETLEELSAFLQALALANLLAGMNEAEFRDNLIRSGHARRYFLRRSLAEQSTSDRHLAVSRTDAQFDCLVGGSMNVAMEIAERSIGSWRGDWEYEDDFWYRKFMDALLLERWGNRNTAAAQILPRLADAIGDTAEPRYRVSRALLERDERGFNEAVFSLLDRHRTRAEQRRPGIVSSELPDALFWLTSFVSIEGLALARLAEISGIAADDDLPLCPDVGRLPMTSIEPPDLFVEVDTEIRERRSGR